MITIERIHYFLKVAEKLSFTQAAQECFVSQTAISQQIALLEKELGLVLFARQRRSVRLTAAGEHLLPMARRLWEDYSGMLTEMERTYRRQDHISVAICGNLEAQLLTTAIPAFRRLHPDIIILPKKIPLENVAQAFDAGECDLAFHITGEISGEGITETEVIHGRMGAAVSLSDPLSAQDSISIEEMRTRPLGLLRCMPGLRSSSLQYDWARSIGYEESQILCADTVEEQQFMVSVNQCISILPEQILTPGVRVVPFRDIEIPYSVSVYCRRPTREINELIGFLKESGRFLSGETEAATNLV